MIETLRNFTKDEIWALDRVISNQLARLDALEKSMAEDDASLSEDSKRLQAILRELQPEIEHAWQIMQEKEVPER